MNLSLKPVDRLSVPYGVENAGLQALKFLCAFLVVVIHTAGCMDHRAFGLTRIAVPVFFMITGFFMVDSRGLIDHKRVWRMMVKLLWITVGAQLFYIGVYAAESLLVKHEIPSDVWSLRAHLYNLIVGDKFGGHLWYLTACLQALLVVWLAVRRGWERLLVWFIPAGLALALLTGCYGVLPGIGKAHSFVCRGVLSTALPCVMIGVVMRRGRLPKVTPALLIMAVVAAALLLFEDNLLKINGGDMIVMTMPLAVTLFAIFAGTRVSPVLAAAGRSYATGIYIMHLAVMRLVEHIDGLAEHPALAVVTFAATLLLLAGWRRLRPAMRSLAGAV
ncbi:MAG: acyltransferase [Bacteroidales bacterium]|nr:acyltransferase [Bacteroidales bacterium]